MSAWLMSDLSLVLLVVFIGVVLISGTAVMLGVKGWQQYQASFTASTESNLEKMFMFVDAKKMFLGNVAMIIGVPALVFITTENMFYVLLSILIVLSMPTIMMKVLEARRKQQIVESLPDALAQISGSMRSGATFTSSIETMVSETKGPIGQEFELLLKEQKMGISQQDSLENLGERISSEDVDLVVTAALISRDVGGNLAEILGRLSVTLRRKIEMEGKIKALTSQGKLQGIVVSMLPFAIIFALVYVEPEGIMPIFSTFLGWGFLAAIVLLEIMGAIMIRKIVSIDV